MLHIHHLIVISSMNVMLTFTKPFDVAIKNSLIWCFLLATPLARSLPLSVFACVFVCLSSASQRFVA